MNRGRLERKLPVMNWPLPSGAACVVLLALTGALNAGAASLRLIVQDARTGERLPGRIHLLDAAGKPVRPPGFPFWHDHFVCAGEVTLDLDPGRYRYTIERGPEWTMAQGEFVAREGGDEVSTHLISRLVDLAREGWWCGDLHVHRPPREIELLLRAEDLHIAPVITWWNSRGPWANAPLPAQPLVRFDGDRFYHLLAGEDERGGGALLYFGLDRPLPLDGARREFPSSTTFLRQARQVGSAGGADQVPVWVEIEKPFWWDTPVWLASGAVDSVGIAHNHLQRGGVLDNEAWGRPRDPARYPGPHGNGRYTQDLYYQILNCGFRLPPSAGSASGVLPNPVGYNRAYVHVEGELTWEKWWAGLRAGRLFVSNGPLLRARANGQWPGHVFRSDEPLTVRLEAALDSRDPIAAVELVRDGRVEAITLPCEITIRESGWFLVRAIADVPHTFRFASTGPWYVEIGGKPLPVRREAAEAFLEWTRERKERVTVALTNAVERAEALGPVLAAERFWEAKVAGAMRRVPVTGRVVDEATREPVPCRLYLQGADGRWHFPESASVAGSAIRYERQNWVNRSAVEYHTTLSAHPFRIELEPGHYAITVERGKEYRALTREFTVGAEPVELHLPLRRWVDLAARGWYSGDTHVHRSLSELPNVMLAEDLNVAFPLTYWVTQGFAPPTQGDKNTPAGEQAGVIEVDAAHVIWPRNTEWEIFTIGERRHTLGAVFALGHRQPFALGAPPVGGMAAAARAEGALLDLDKHDWPWSMALVPVMGVDLFELANNHHWRTTFAFTNWSTPAPAWMNPPNEGRNGTERDWTLYGFQNYYALLNCGFRLRPTAGTASGVHPVPLGFSRVYVHLPDGFRYDAWIEGLDAGRSFVTTGPMLLVTVNGHPPGHRTELPAGTRTALRVVGEVLSEQPLEAIELVVNGAVVRRLEPRAVIDRDGAWHSRFEEAWSGEGSAWVAVRCWEQREQGRVRFAHTAPWFFDVAGAPVRPRRAEVEFLVQRVRDEIERSAGVLPAEALAEYRSALAAYEGLRSRAVP